MGFLWVAQDALLIQLKRNEQDSSDDLAEHVESISNVSSDDDASMDGYAAPPP